MPFTHVINWFVKLSTCDHRRRKCEYRGHLTIKKIQAVAFSFWRRTLRRNIPDFTFEKRWLLVRRVTDCRVYVWHNGHYYCMTCTCIAYLHVAPSRTMHTMSIVLDLFLFWADVYARVFDFLPTIKIFHVPMHGSSLSLYAFTHCGYCAQKYETNRRGSFYLEWHSRCNVWTRRGHQSIQMGSYWKWVSKKGRLIINHKMDNNHQGHGNNRL